MNATIDAPARSSQLVARTAGRLYRGLLWCYPRQVREDVAEDAAALFAEVCAADWTRAGIGPVARRIAAAMVRVPSDGWAERRSMRRRGTAVPAGSPGPSFVADLRHSLRAVRRRAGLSAAVVATLAIGLGINTAAFSVLDATLLRPLPFVHANRVMWLEATATSQRPIHADLSWAKAWAGASTSIERIEARRWRSVLVTGAGAATRERLIESTPGYLDSMNARPILGRLLVPGDEAPGGPRIVVISEGFWRERYGAAHDVVNQRLTLDGVPYQIVGVASDIPSDIPGLRFRVAAPLVDNAGAPSGVALPIVAWLKPGVSPVQADAEMSALARVVDGDRELRPVLTRPQNIFWTLAEFRTTVLGIASAALLLLLIAGVNVANLLLAAGQARAGDFALRRAIGASTFRLVRLQLIETTMLALAGTGIGLGLAWAAVRGLAAVSAGPQLQTPLESIRIDPMIAAYAVVAALVTALVSGMAPALRGARAGGDLRAIGGRSATAQRRGPAALVAVETAVAAVLLVGAGVVAHAFLSMHFAQRGFDADRVLGVRIELPDRTYPTPSARAAFFETLLADAVRLPGVEQAGVGYGAVPPTDFVSDGDLTIAGSGEAPANVSAAVSYVTPGYFALMGIPLLQGTELGPARGPLAAGAGQPVVVSRSLAERFWPHGGAVGAAFQIASSRRTTRYQVVGVAGDVSVWGMMVPSCKLCDPQLYLPLPQERRYTDVLLRIRRGAPLPAAALQAAVTRLDPDVPASEELHSAEAALADFIQQPRFIAVIFATFAVLAVLLVAVGLSAVVSHAVARRTREMGIRLALGASPAGLRRLVIAQGLRPALAGVAAGLVAGALLTRLMRSLLYGLSPADPVTLVGAPALLIAITLLALLVPAVRATRADPARTLRAE